LNFDSLFLPGIGHQLIAPLSGQLNSISRSSPPLAEELPCGSGSGHLSRLAEKPPLSHSQIFAHSLQEFSASLHFDFDWRC